MKAFIAAGNNIPLQIIWEFIVKKLKQGASMLQCFLQLCRRTF